VRSLKLRPTGLASPVDNDRHDYTVYSGEWPMGRMYEERGQPGTSALVLVHLRHSRQTARRAHWWPRANS
jgi:hypothetical protein